MLDPNTSLAPTTTSHPVTRALQNNKEVHPVDTGRRIIPRKKQSSIKIFKKSTTIQDHL
jgi:hypothetical protein